MNRKVCSICYEEKEISEFPRVNGYALSYCKLCRTYVKNHTPNVEKTCMGCFQVLPYYRFAHDKRYEYGLALLCRNCAVTKKVCTSCNQAKDKLEFHANGKNKDGSRRAYTICKTCWFTKVKGVASKECRACHREYPVTDFVSRRLGSDLEEFCSQCRMLYQTCTDCKKTKPLGMFSITNHRQDGTPIYRKQCKPCHVNMLQDRYKSDIQFWREYHRKKEKMYRRNDPNRYATYKRKSKSRRRTKYADFRNDLTLDQWQFLLDEAGNMCLSCGTTFGDTNGTRATADHVYNGANGLIDGLTLRNVQPLCASCNAAKNRYHATDYRPLALREKIYAMVISRDDMGEEELTETWNLLFTGSFNPERLKVK